jgi:hypothetical protein
MKKGGNEKCQYNNGIDIPVYGWMGGWVDGEKRTPHPYHIPINPSTHIRIF